MLDVLAVVRRQGASENTDSLVATMQFILLKALVFAAAIENGQLVQWAREGHCGW